jgi:hypothetical protein
MRDARTEKRTFGGIKRPISYVPHVNLTQHWIGFAYALQDGSGTDPKRNRQTNSPQGRQAEGQSDGDQKRH